MKRFMVFNPSSKMIIGYFPSESEARMKAQGLPGVKICDVTAIIEEGKLQFRSDFVTALKARGVNGLLTEAIIRQLDVKAAQRLFQGRSEREIIGSAAGHSSFARQPQNPISPQINADDWNDPAIRAEFGNDRSLFETYNRVQSEGKVNIIGGRTIH